MTITPDPIDPENPENLPATVLAFQNAVIEMTGCVSDALPDICSVGFTIGESYVPFDPDPGEACKSTEAKCSQAWLRIMNILPKGVSTGFGGADCSMSLTADIEVGVLRCIPTPKKGKAPTETDVLVYAMQAFTDANAILCAVTSCDAWDEVPLVGRWNPSGPLGGQYGGIWTFSVELS